MRPATLRITRAGGVFALSTALLFAATVVFTPAGPRPETLPLLHPGPEEPPTWFGPSPVSQLAATIPADPAQPGSRPALGWLLLPSAPSGRAAVRHPGVVLVHGSGPASRNALLAEARALASAGVAAIVYDKRTRGYSPVRRVYGALADDAVRAARTLADAPGVNPDAIGIMGWSEGGWVAPLAVRRDPGRFGFLALVSAPIVSPAEQAAWTIRRTLPAGPSWPDRVIGTLLSAGGELIDYLDHDTRPVLADLQVPVLGVWGAEDTTVPVNRAVRTVVEQVPSPVTASIVPSAGHRLALESDYLRRAAGWMRSLPAAGAADQIRGTEPASATGVPALPAPAWFAHPLVHLGVSLALTVAFLVRPRLRFHRPAGVLA